MGVLRQKLTERDEERGQLERKVTELSATVSSTLASYTFLEQALTSETTKYDPNNNTNILIKGNIVETKKNTHIQHAGVTFFLFLFLFRLQQSWKDVQQAKDRANE